VAQLITWRLARVFAGSSGALCVACRSWSVSGAACQVYACATQEEPILMQPVLVQSFLVVSFTVASGEA
jgi:hypothetical protein